MTIYSRHLLLLLLTFLALFAGAASFALAQGTAEVGVEAEASVDADIQSEIDTSSEQTASDGNATERDQEAADRQAERAGTMEQRQGDRTDAAEARGELSTERKTALQQLAQTRITNLAANMSNRMEAAIGRMRNVIARLESRMDKLDERGIETVAARAELSVAVRHINEAAATLGNIDAEVAAFVGSENPRETWKNVKALFESSRDSLRLAHASLKKVIELLREAITQNATARVETATEAAISAETAE